MGYFYLMRKPKNETPLRQVRLASGRSQKEFAVYLGLNPHLYHSLELGRVKLTRDKANCIAQKTGVAPESLDPKTRRLALSMDGGPYTKDSWKSWQDGRSWWPWQRVKDLLQWTTFLCKIADQEGRLAELCFELCDCLTKARDKFNLDSVVERELIRTKARMGFLCKYGDLRANRELAQRMGFRDEDSKVPDDRVWNKVITYTPSWSPHSLLPPELAKRFNVE
jgi:transcriptional regulator with XRE-family HTH domain